MRKIRILLVFMIMLTTSMVWACPFFNGINKVIKKMDLKLSSIVSISVREKETGKILYQKDDKKLLNPASTLKMLSFAPILNTLGENYKFETAIYKSGKNLYIKLGADPLLTDYNLRELVSLAKNKVDFNSIEKIYIDDTIIDKVNYPKGWGSDDIYPNYPIVSPYTLNKNQVKISVLLRDNFDVPYIMQTEPNNLSIINELIKGAGDIKIQVADDYDSANIIVLKGAIDSDIELNIPVSNPKYNFIANLNDVFKKEKVVYKKPFYFEKTPKGATLVATVYHTLEEVSRDILWNSDNFSAEVAFKVAGGKYANEVGTTKNARFMLKDYYEALGLDMSGVQIFDGSGVSRMNLVTSSFMTEALRLADIKNSIKKYAPKPTEGTLKNRMRHLSDNLNAKTGTLNAVSSICGFIKTKSDKDLVFNIIIMNFKQKPAIIKGFEDDIIDKIWKF